MKLSLLAPVVALAFLAFSGPASAAPIAIDEFGNGVGTIGRGFFATDPGPDGLPSVLTYRLPFAGVAGDVVLREGPAFTNGSDLLRFNGNGTLVVYSVADVGEGVPEDPGAGDVALTPGQIRLQSNFVILNEVGPEGLNGISYTPNLNQPGFDSSGPTYNFVSDVPEPSTLILLASGLTGLAVRQRKQRQRK